MLSSVDSLLDLSALTDRADRLVKAAHAAGADAADAVAVRSMSLAIEVRDGNTEESERAEGDDLGLRVFVGRRQAVVSTNEVTANGATALAERAVAMARATPEDKFAGLADDKLLAHKFPELDLIDPDLPSVQELEAMLAKMLTDGGGRPVCLSRGYGGSEAGPKLVDGRSDSAAQVGDEALLLARAAPTVVARDRVGGAEFARAQGASLIILDDGLQNPSLAKDFTLAVIDAQRGIGNARVFPAGPLRAPLDAQLARTDALLVVGEGNAADGVAARLRAQSRPVFHARLVPDKAAVSALSGHNVLAFAGIGDPDKFFATARAAGIVVSRRRAFPDHHRYTPQDASELILRAEHSGLTLLTTEKDRARMAMKVWHWPFLAQPEPLPEMLITKAPVEYLEWKMASWTKAKNLSAFDQRAMDHYRAAFSDPLRIHAHCEDYRAGRYADLANDEADRKPGRTIGCPLFALWGGVGIANETGGPLEIWKKWAPGAAGKPIDSGHFLTEENPDATAAAMRKRNEL